jgi:hypothetical protein
MKAEWALPRAAPIRAPSTRGGGGSEHASVLIMGSVERSRHARSLAKCE